MANFQKKWPNEHILYADVEGTYDAKWASNMGVDSSNVIILNCVGQYAEEIFDQLKGAMETGAQVAEELADAKLQAEKERAAREGHNPFTGEKITIAASKNAAFSASKALKEALNK